MLEVEALDGLCDADGLLLVDRQGLSFGDRAVATAARADLAQQQKRRGAVVPAFANVRAVGLLADGVEAVVTHQVDNVLVVLACGRTNFQPLRAPGVRCCGGGSIRYWRERYKLSHIKPFMCVLFRE